MGVRLKRFPEYGVLVAVFTGLVTREDLYEHLSSLREGEPLRFLGYFDPTADMTALSVEEIAGFKAASAAKLGEIKVEHALAALVCPPGPNAHFVDFWCRYVQLDGDRPTTPALFSGMKSACAWLGLPDRAREVLTEEVEPETAPGRTAPSESEDKFPEPRI
jgi:hypothetical protein